MSEETGTSQSHTPTMQISNEGDYDVSTMMDITHANQESEGDSDGENRTANEVFDDSNTEEDVSSDEVLSDSDDSEELEGDAGPETDDSFDEEESRESQEARDEFSFEVDGKEVKVPKDAEVELKIDGKKEKMTLQEALNQASGKIHVHRELNRVRERETKLETSISDFRAETAKVNANAEALLEIKDPYELCEYICDLKGGDPDQMFQDMLRNTVEHYQRYSKMTETELQQDRKLRRYERMERQRNAELKQSEAVKASTQKEQQLVETLKEEGFEKEQFFSTLDELKQKADNGEELGFGLDSIENPTEDDIIDYMAAKDLHDRVTNGVTKLSADLTSDTAFIEKAKQALLRYESLSGKMNQAEVDSFVRQALELDNKALSESLSRKAKKAKSKPVNSQEQEFDEDEGPGSLEELNNSLRNLSF